MNSALPEESESLDYRLNLSFVICDLGEKGESETPWLFLSLSKGVMKSVYVEQ